MVRFIKGKKHGRYYKRGRRHHSAMTIQRAWRYRSRRRKPGLVARTALANRNAINLIKRNVDSKFTHNTRAVSTNNFVGQIYRCPTITSKGGTSAQGTAQTYKYQVIQPLCLLHKDNSAQLTSTAGTAAGYIKGLNTRADSWVTMKSLTLKYHFYAGDSADNYNYISGIPQSQKVYMLVVLDRQPPQASEVPNTATGWAPNFNPAVLFPQPSTNTYPQDGVNNPQWADSVLDTKPMADKDDPGHFSFLNPQTTYGPHARFKILKKKIFYLKQRTRGPTTLTATSDTFLNEGTKNYPGEINGQITLKGNYKLHYPKVEDCLPVNQNILIFLYSDVIHNAAPGTNANVEDPPGVELWCKFRFKDT